MLAQTGLRAGWRTGAVAGVVALTVALLAPVSGAQEIGEPEPEGGDRLEVVGQFDLPEGASTTSDLWVWPEARTGFFFTGTSSGTGAGAGQLAAPDHHGMVAIDLDTFEPVARTDPDADGFPYWIHRRLAQGRPNSPKFGGMVVDGENARLFVPHHNAVGHGGQGGVFGGDVLGAVPPGAANTARCNPVGPGGLQGSDPCFAGVYVLDARTLKVTRNLPFLQAGLDAVGVQFHLLDLSYTPNPGAEGKVHVLLEDQQMTSLANVAGLSSLPDPRQRSNQQYAAQIDVATGRTDWVVRLGSCVGSRTLQISAPEGAIFRSPDPSRPVVWVGCWAAGSNVTSIVRLDLDTSSAGETGVAGQQAFVSPGAGHGFLKDPAAERIFVKTAAIGSTETLWWAFDGLEGGFVARAGVGVVAFNENPAAVDPVTGRLYTVAPDDAKGAQRGVGWVDGRRTELPQFTWDPKALAGDVSWIRTAVWVDPAGGERPTRLLVKASASHILVLEDKVPVSVDPVRAEAAGSDDVAEREGATAATYDASARGYGARTILVGGLAGLAGRDRVGPGLTTVRVESPCGRPDRTLVLGLAGSHERSAQAKIDNLGTAAAAAQATYADPGTERDLERPYSNCRAAGDEWDELLSDVIRGGPEEPSARSVPGREDSNASPLPGADQVSCSAPDQTSDEAADPVVGGLTAQVGCDDGVVSALSRARMVGLGPVDVAEAGSTFRVERRDGGGVVARVESWSRGVTITGEQGAVKIDLIRAVATVWANGRAQPEDVADDPNCDEARTAGSCYVRLFSGAQVVDAGGATVFSCDPCADRDSQQRLVAGMQSVLGSNWLVSAPDPDPAWAPGSGDGAQVAVLKRESTQFADENLKGDLLATMPALELVRVNDTTHVLGPDITPGGSYRQVFQFAGVEADMSYGISCLLVITDGECAGEPASLDIELTDVLGVPLPGGGFEVHAADEDGLLGLDESLGDPLVCVTGPDGTCGFDTVAPGTYVVQQVAAPDGYVPMEDEVIDLPAGGHGTLTVVNGTLPVTGIAITLTDLDGQALEGGQFEVHAGEAAAGAVGLASCTTDELGVCRFPVPALDLVEDLLPLDLVETVLPDAPEGLLQVPAGAYTVRQAGAPEGFEPVDDVGFDLPEGQIARVALSNAPPFEAADDGSIDGAGFDTGDIEPVTGPVSVTAPPPVAEPAFTVDFPDRPEPPPLVAGAEEASTGQQILMLPGDVARFALRHPKEALAFGGVLLLFAAAAAGAYRRRLVLELLSG